LTTCRLPPIVLVIAAAGWAGPGADASPPDKGAHREVRAKPAAAARVRVLGETELRAELRKHKGRPLLLHFWATWCAPCVSNLPMLAKAAASAKRKGVDFVAVSLDDGDPRSRERVAALLAKEAGDAHWSVILRTLDAAAFVRSIDPDWRGEIPAFFVYDGDLRLRRAHLGDINERDLAALIASLAPPEE
jgi:thiol-disulfide isomerase/thioredoxin